MKRYFIILVGMLMISAFALEAQTNEPWVVPKKYTTMKNPVEADESSVLEGHDLYQANCISCHGEKGTGNGEMAAKLKENPSDFTLDDMDVQTDGDLFYKIKNGRDEMHSFDKTLSNDNIWNIVNYLRTFYEEE